MNCNFLLVLGVIIYTTLSAFILAARKKATYLAHFLLAVNFKEAVNSQSNRLKYTMGRSQPKLCIPLS